MHPRSEPVGASVGQAAALRPNRKVGRRAIAHVDMDAFFAAVEQLRHPELRGRPVVVGGHGDPTERGVVSTASYEARKFGIHSAMPLRTAYRHCPQAVFLPVDYEAYAEVAERIHAVLHAVSPQVEDVGLDEAFVDISGTTGPPEAVARSIKARILAETGLTCSVGIGPNKLLAKIASDLEKPDGLTVLSADAIVTRMWPLPVRRLPGVGPKTEARLRALKVFTIGELAALSPDTLALEFGPARGHDLFMAARGIDDSAVVTEQPPPQSIGRQITFQHDIADRTALAKALDALAREVAEDARATGCRGTTVAARVRFADFETVSRQMRLKRPSGSAAALRRAARACFDRVRLDKRVRLVGVRLGGLVPRNLSGRAPRA